MKKQAKNRHVSPLPRRDEDAPSMATAEPAMPAGPAITRFVIPLDDANAIQFGQMRETSRARLRHAFVNDENLRALGLQRAASGPSPSFTPEMVAILYDALGMVAMMGARTAGYAIEDARLMLFTADEKHVLVPATLPVLAKYGGAFKYEAEVTLAATLLMLTIAKYQMLAARPKPGKVIPFGAPVPSSDLAPDQGADLPDGVS